MREQEVRELYEAYLEVYQEQELDEALDKEFASMRKRGGRSAPPDQRSIGGEANRRNKDYWADEGGPNRDRGAGNKAKRRAAELNKEEVETDLFDVILEHLVAEGYADTNEAALAIMANMSEEWRQSIVEETFYEKKGERPRGLPYGPVGKKFRELTIPQRKKMLERGKEHTRTAMNSSDEYSGSHAASSAIDSALRSRRLGGRG